MIDFKVILLIFLIILVLDKGLTMLNIIQVNKNFPEQMKEDPYKIEKNPLAKKAFEKFGLYGGTIVYLIIGLITLTIAYYFLKMAFGESVGLYILVLAYGLVIANNFYFLFKYSRMIP